MVRLSEYPTPLITVFAIWRNFMSYRSFTAHFPRPISKLFCILSLGLKVVAFQNYISLIFYNGFIRFTCPTRFNFLIELFYPHEVIPLIAQWGNISSFLFISPLFISKNCLKIILQKCIMENGKYTEPNSITLTKSRIRLDENLQSKNAVFVTCTRLLIYLSLRC